jgi:valyl-tRNA synthetase
LYQLREKQEAQAKVVTQLEGRLNNEAYVRNAPKALVEQSRAQLEEAKALTTKLREEYERFAGSNK